MQEQNVLITVFTPTYNRKSCISNCYNSLKRQTSKNFKWLIIDDGSTDDTKSLIESWQNETSDFEIFYDYKENGGLHTAYNRGIELADTELFVCIDSDDWMPDNSIERIEAIWSEVAKKGYVGIMGIDCYENGNTVGDKFPENINEMYLYEKLTNYNIAGDKKMAHRLELLKKVAPMPVFEGEKFFNPSYLMYQLDKFGKLFVTNECFCIVEYQPDGMSSNMFKQYYNSPNSFAEIRKQYLSFPNTSLMFKIKHTIHYVSSCFLSATPFNSLKVAKNKTLTLLCLFPGLALSLLIKMKVKN